jgi:two-component system response regulator RegA
MPRFWACTGERCEDIDMNETAVSQVATPARALQRLLVVEDNDALRRTLALALADRASDVRSAATLVEAESLIREWHPDAVVLDFALPDGNAFDVLRVIAETEPLPAMVAMSGMAEPAETFRLAQLGVRAFVSKPIDPEALDQALDTAPDLVPMVRAAVGHVGVQQVEAQVRSTMVSEALARAQGSRNRAARLLSISRQLLQHILKKDA